METNTVEDCLTSGICPCGTSIDLDESFTADHQMMDSMTNRAFRGSHSLSHVAQLVLVVPVFIGIPESAFATDMASVLCNAIDIILGSPGRALATLAIIFLGIGSMLGKVSWGLAITVAVGISVIFNAGGIVTALTGLSLAQGCINTSLY